MLTKQQFYAGQVFVHDGIEYRILAGNRCAGDLVLEFRQLYNGWFRPKIAHTLILVAFKSQVEENNYGPHGEVKPGNGYRYLWWALRSAAMDGWQGAASRVLGEARQARERRRAA